MYGTYNLSRLTTTEKEVVLSKIKKINDLVDQLGSMLEEAYQNDYVDMELTTGSIKDNYSIYCGKACAAMNTIESFFEDFSDLAETVRVVIIEALADQRYDFALESLSYIPNYFLEEAGVKYVTDGKTIDVMLEANSKIHELYHVVNDVLEFTINELSNRFPVYTGNPME